MLVVAFTATCCRVYQAGLNCTDTRPAGAWLYDLHALWLGVTAITWNAADYKKALFKRLTIDYHIKYRKDATRICLSAKTFPIRAWWLVKNGPTLARAPS